MHNKVKILDIIKNIFILFPFIKEIAKKTHKTGIMNDPKSVFNRVDEIFSIIQNNSMSNVSVLEIGPGQTSDVITELAKFKEVKNAYAIDINDYFDDKFWHAKGVHFINGDLSSFSSGSFDFVYCYDVLEHIKKPTIFLKQLRSALSKSGMAYLSWDMRDHFYINDESNWFEMHKYNNFIWNLQMSNRSSYVNRLQLNQWLKNFELAGFEILSIKNLESSLASNNMQLKYGLQINPVYRSKIIVRIK